MLRYASALVAILALAALGAAQNAVTSLKQSPMWVDKETMYVSLLEEVKSPVIVDVANISLAVDLENELQPIPQSWLGEFAVTYSRDVKAQGTGLVVYRVPPSSVIASASRGRVFHTWLLGASADELDKLLDGGMSLSELDSNASYVSRNAMRSHPFGMGAIAQKPEDFQARIILSLRMTMPSTPGTVSKFFEKPLTPKPSRPMTLKPVPEVEPIDASHQVVDWESGQLTTIHEAVTRLNRECGLFFNIDPKVWNAPVFIKGKWDAEDLAESILIIADAPRGTFRRGDDFSALSDAYDALLDKASNEFGVPDEIYNAAKGGETLPFETVVKYFPETFAHLKTENGYSVSMRDRVSFELALMYNIAGPGTVRVKLGGGEAITPNAALLGAQRPKTSGS